MIKTKKVFLIILAGLIIILILLMLFIHIFNYSAVSSSDLENDINAREEITQITVNHKSESTKTKTK